MINFWRLIVIGIGLLIIFGGIDVARVRHMGTATFMWICGVAIIIIAMLMPL
jgi:hypothetical protein